MPISAEQWKAVVGSNNVKRPRQVGLKRYFIEHLVETLQRSMEASNKPKPPKAKRRHKNICEHLKQEEAEDMSTICGLSSSLSCDVLLMIFVTSILLLLVTTYSSTYGDAMLPVWTLTDCLSHSGTSVATVCLQGLACGIISLLLLLSGDVETNPGPGDYLTLSDLREVNSALFHVRANWNKLGVQLLVHPGTLAAIQEKHPSSPDNCLLALLEEWLKSGKRTWRDIIEALKSKVLGEANLAGEIEQEHCKRPGGKRILPDFECPVSKKPCTVEGEIDFSKMEKYAKHLKTKYTEQTLPAEGLLEHSNKICRLAMIKKEKISRPTINDDFVKQTITGKVDDILHRKTPIELRDIFEGVPKDRKVVLIEGAPGAGKSSLSLNICKKWSEGEMFQEYKLVILVRLRDPNVQAAKTISDLLPYCDESLRKEIEHIITATSGEGILWVLDGWDEFPEKWKKDEICFVRNLIYHQNHCSSVVVTSRPTSSINLHFLVSKRIEVLGFTSDELKQYFEYRLGDSKSVDTLLEKIKQHPEVQSSCYLPLHAGFIADTFLVKRDLPSTQYSIFETVIVKCISRYLQKKGQLKIQSLDDLSGDMKRNFSEICQLAYRGVLENRIIFTEDDLPPNFKTLDLLQEVQSMVAFQGGVSRTFNFLHLSIQEFLAAQQLAEEPEYKQYWLFRGLMEDDRCFPMLTFYAAKTKLSAPGIRDFVTTVGDRYQHATKEHERGKLCGLLTFVFKCICETEDPALCIPVVAALNGHFFDLEQTDYYALGSFLSLSTRAKVGNKLIDLGTVARSFFYGQMYIDDQEWDMFMKGLLRFLPTHIVSPLRVELSISDLDDPVLMSRAFHTLKLTANPLCIPTGRLDEDRMLPGNDCLKVLHITRLSHLNLIAWIGRGLQYTNGLCELCFTDTTITMADLNLFSEGLSTTNTLEVLVLNKCQAISLNEHDLAYGIRNNQSLKKLAAVNCNFTSESDLVQAASGHRTLEYLHLENDYLTDKDAHTVAQNCQLQQVIMISQKLTSQGARSLLEVYQIGQLSTLIIGNGSFYVYENLGLIRELNVVPSLPTYQCDDKFDNRTLAFPVEDGGAKLVAEIVQHGLHIPLLCIKGDSLTPDGFNTLFHSLSHGSRVETLRVNGGVLSTRSLCVLGEALRENTSLKAIELSIDSEVEPADNINDALTFLAKCLSNNTTLRTIDLPKKCDSWFLESEVRNQRENVQLKIQHHTESVFLPCGFPFSPNIALSPTFNPHEPSNPLAISNPVYYSGTTSIAPGFQQPRSGYFNPETLMSQQVMYPEHTLDISEHYQYDREHAQQAQFSFQTMPPNSSGSFMNITPPFTTARK